MNTTNTYTKLRKNASLKAVAEAAVLSAKRAERAYETYRDQLPQGVLLEFNQISTRDRLWNDYSERHELAKHMARLAKIAY